MPGDSESAAKVHVPSKREREAEGVGDDWDEAKARAYAICSAKIDESCASAIDLAIGTLGPSLQSIFESCASAQEGPNLVPAVLIDLGWGERDDASRSLVSFINKGKASWAVSLGADECSGGGLAALECAAGTGAQREERSTLSIVIQDVEGWAESIFNELVADLSEAVLPVKILVLILHSDGAGFPVCMNPCTLGLLRVKRLTVPPSSWILDAFTSELLLTCRLPLALHPDALRVLQGLFLGSHHSLRTFAEHLRFLLFVHFEEEPCSPLPVMSIDKSFMAEVMMAIGGEEGLDVIPGSVDDLGSLDVYSLSPTSTSPRGNEGLARRVAVAFAVHAMHRWLCAALCTFLLETGLHGGEEPSVLTVVVDVLERGDGLVSRAQASLDAIGRMELIPLLRLLEALGSAVARSDDFLDWILTTTARYKEDVSSVQQARISFFLALSAKVKELESLGSVCSAPPVSGKDGGPIVEGLRYEAQVLLESLLTSVQGCSGEAGSRAVVFPSACTRDELEERFDPDPRAAQRRAVDDPHSYLDCNCASEDSRFSHVSSAQCAAYQVMSHVKGRAGFVSAADWHAGFAEAARQHAQGGGGRGGDAERAQISSRFLRAVRDLEFSGFVCRSKRVDSLPKFLRLVY